MVQKLESTSSMRTSLPFAMIMESWVTTNHTVQHEITPTQKKFGPWMRYDPELDITSSEVILVLEEEDGSPQTLGDKKIVGLEVVY